MNREGCSEHLEFYTISGHIWTFLAHLKARIIALKANLDQRIG